MNTIPIESIRTLTKKARLQVQKLEQKKRKTQNEIWELATFRRDIAEVENYLKAFEPNIVLKKYQIGIFESQSGTVVVEATSEEEARKIVESRLEYQGIEEFDNVEINDREAHLI